MGRGFVSITLVGRFSSTRGVEGRRTDDGSRAAFFFTYFCAGPSLGVDLVGVDFLGVTGFGGAKGEDSRRLAADSRRSRAGSTRLCGVVVLLASSMVFPRFGTKGAIRRAVICGLMSFEVTKVTKP